MVKHYQDISFQKFSGINNHHPVSVCPPRIDFVTENYFKAIKHRNIFSNNVDSKLCSVIELKLNRFGLVEIFIQIINYSE
jgi:hypothetical protein